jgi:hypothetical protein
MRSRRQFIKVMGVLGGAVMAPFRWFGRAQAATLPDAPLPAGAELYGGFLLLPEGAPVPPWVKPPKLGPPIECGVGEGGASPTAVVVSLKAPGDLASESGLPIYALGKLPDGIREAGGYVLKQQTGEVFSALVGYETYNYDNQYWECTVRIIAKPDFPRPFPLWPVSPVEVGGPAILLEKVDFLPTPGIMVKTTLGHIFHWIQKGVLYTLVVENKSSLGDARLLVDTLLPMR